MRQAFAQGSYALIDPVTWDPNPVCTSILNFSITVNVVIFAGGKFRENVGKTFHVGVIFTILLIFP